MTKRKPKHAGFYLTVDDQPAHILGDPDMPPEALDALERLIMAARKMVEDMPVYECPECGKMSSGREGRACTKCMIDELWKGIK